MNRSDLQELQSVHDTPAISILMPTHRGHPDNRQDGIRLRNLIHQAASRLHADFPRREADSILAQIEALAATVDFRQAQAGLALFASRSLARQFYLPFDVIERVVINRGFVIRDLVYALNRSPRYWVLVLSEKPTRLYAGQRDVLDEVLDYGFPLTHTGPGGTQPLPSGYGVRRSAHRDESYRQFFRQVDAGLAQAMRAETLPLIVTGIERYQAVFGEVTTQSDRLVAVLPGNHDKATPHELARRIWPLVQAELRRQQQAALQELEVASAAGQAVSGLRLAWEQAQLGRGAHLLVESGYHQPAHLGPDGQTLDLALGQPAADVLADAVDELIETVLTRGGRVTFVEDEGLAAHGRLALTLRY